MSDTPRTDKERYSGDIIGLAGTLERELAVVGAQLDQCKKMLNELRALAYGQMLVMVEKLLNDVDARDAEVARLLKSQGRIFDAGWITAANWAARDDLITDMGSDAYLGRKERAIALSAALAQTKESR